MEKLRIYQKGLELVKSVYELIQHNQQLTKDFSLCDQLKRAAVSVPANISEGYLRTRKQFRNYLQISSGSSNEMITLLKIVELVYAIDTAVLQNEYRLVAKQIVSFSQRLNTDSN